MATRLVEQWLKIVKGESNIVDLAAAAAAATSVVNGGVDTTQPNDVMMDTTTTDGATVVTVDASQQHASEDVSMEETTEVQSNEKLVFKITVKDGKQVLAKVEPSPTRTTPVKRTNSSENCVDDAPSANKIIKLTDGVAAESRLKTEESDGKSVNSKDKSSSGSSSNSKGDGKSERSDDRNRDKNRREKGRSDRDKIRSSDKDRKDRKDVSKSSSSDSKSPSYKKSSSSSSSSHRSSSSSNHKNSSSKSSSSSSSRRESSDKYKSSKSSSSSSSSRSKSNTRDKESGSSSSKSIEPKVSQSDKDKDTLAKVIPQSISKLGKIPKKQPSIDGSDDPSVAAAAAATTKKASISIEVRKDVENRPKTVKTFNSQFRSHGLAEEAPPPPSRRGLKKPTSSSTPGTSIPPSLKSQSPPRLDVVSEKRAKIEAAAASSTGGAEKPGAIKLIAPKPKRKYSLLNSIISNAFLFFFLLDSISAKSCVDKKYLFFWDIVCVQQQLLIGIVFSLNVHLFIKSILCPSSPPILPPSPLINFFQRFFLFNSYT